MQNKKELVALILKNSRIADFKTALTNNGFTDFEVIPINPGVKPFSTISLNVDRSDINRLTKLCVATAANSNCQN